LVQDLYPGSTEGKPTSITAVGSRHLWFAARARNSTTQLGRELWSFDVLTGKAQLQADIYPSSYDSNPEGFEREVGTPFVVSQGRVFFSALHPSASVELLFVDNGATAQRQGQPCQASTLESTDPVLGGTANVAGRTRAGFVANVLLLGAASPKPVPVTGSCMLYFSLFGPMITMQVSTGTTYGLPVPIPASPSFSGMQLVLQSVHLGATFPGKSGFSNPIEWTLGN